MKTEKIKVIQEINKAFSIVKELRKRSFLKKEWSLFYGRCPFCGMYWLAVSEPQNIYYCFSCKEWGNVASYIMQRDNLLIKELSMLIEINDDTYRQALKQWRRVVQILTFAQEYFEKNLFHWNWDNAVVNKYQQYLESRCLKYTDADNWGIWLALDAISFFKEAHSKWFSHEDLIEAGLMTSYGDAFFRNRIMFPLRDSRGIIIGFTGRSLDHDPKYLNSPTSPLYDKSSFFYWLDRALPHIKDNNTVVIVEGQMDTIAMHANWIPFTLGVSGTAFTENHVTILRRLIPKGNVILMFDSDEAGVKATLRAWKMLEGLFELSVSFSKLWKDASDHFKDGWKMIDFETVPYSQFIIWQNPEILTESEDLTFDPNASEA